MTKLWFKGHRVPEHMEGAIARWIEHGIPGGGFLEAVVRNDLRGACMAADDINRYHLFDIVAFFWNRAPAACWGSPEAVARWQKMGGLRGAQKELVE